MAIELTSLDKVLSAQFVNEELDVLSVPSGFRQGKATFGGLSVGACVRSLQSRVANPARKLRSVSAQLVGAPQVGESEIHIRLLRETATVETLSAVLVQNERVMTNLVAVFANDRNVPYQWSNMNAPDVPDWQSVEPLSIDHPSVPEFTRQFEYRSIGPLPYAGSSSDPIGYIRPRVPCTNRDGAYWACLIDAWWLAAYGRFADHRPAATLTYTTELHWPEGDLDSDDPVLHVGKTHFSRHGYSLETRELWTPDGKLISTGSQVVAIIK